MDRRIEDALEVLQRKDGFLASVAYAVDDITIEELPVYPMAAACTDYKRIMIDPRHPGLADNPEELVFSLAHECSHILRAHAMRRGGRDPMGWNLCCDKVINRELGRFLTVPPDRPIDHTEASEEELYKQEDGEGGQSYCYTEPDESDATVAQIMQRVEAIVDRAQKAGSEHGMLKSLPPKDVRLPLVKVLRNLVVKGRADYTFKRPSRASRIAGVYLPSLGIKPAIGRVMVSLDTSGSMSDDEQSKGIGAIKRAAKDGGMERLTVVCQDTVSTVVYDGPPEGYTYKPMRSGGGTDFRPLMKLAKELKPKVLVAITDLDGPHGDNPGCKVLWVVSSAHYTKPPFGTVCKW